MFFDYVFVDEHMHIKRQQRNICILFITFILLLGMCFDCVEIDSFLSYKTMDASTKLSRQNLPIFECDYTTSFINQFCSSELLGRQPSSTLQKQTIRRSFAYLFMYFPPSLLSSIFISKFYDFMPDIRKTSIIIRYIQHKDGKKPPRFF